MSPTLASSISLALLTFLAACGGSTSSDVDSGGPAAGAGGSSAGSGGASAGAAGSSAGSGGASAGSGGSDACAVPGTGAGPYDISFMLTNPSQKSIWLWQDCQLSAEISGCPDYAAPIALSGSCTSDCEDYQGCLACGACMSQPLEIPPGGSKPFAWAGYTYTFDTVQGCACHHTKIAPAGKYRLSVSVWDTAPSVDGPKPPVERVVVHDFELHAKQQAETVSLAP